MTKKADRQFLVEQIRIEECQAAENCVYQRLTEVSDLPFAKTRSDLFAAALLNCAIQLVVELQGAETAAEVLHRIADDLGAADPQQKD